MEIPSLNGPDINLHYQTIFEALPVAALVIGTEGEVFTANQAAENLLGLEAGQMRRGRLFNPAWELLSEDGAPLAGETFAPRRPGQCLVLALARPGEPPFRWLKASWTGLPYSNPRAEAASLLTFEDISAVKTAERALRDIRVSVEKRQSVMQNYVNRFDHAFHTVPLARAMGRISDERFTDANEMFLDLFEYEREQVIGKTSLDLKLFETEQDRVEIIAILKTSGGIYSHPVNLLTRTGKRLSVLYSAAFINLGGEDLFLTTLVDISKEKRAEALQRYYASILDNLQEAVIAAGMDHRITAWNKAAEQLFGYTPEEVLGKPFHELFTFPAEKSNFGAMMTVTEGEIRVSAKNGQALELESSMVPHFDDKGELLGFINISRDISQRKRAEVLLLETEQHLLMAAHAGNVGLWDFDVRSGQIYFSEEGLRQLGYDKEEGPIDIAKWRKWIHPDDLKTVSDAIRQVFKEHGFHLLCEYRLRHKDGSYRWFLSESEIFYTETGAPQRLLGAHIDFTDRKQTELALFESRETYRGLVSAMDSVVIQFERSGQIQFINEYGAKLWKFTPAEMIGKRFNELIAVNNSLRRLLDIQDVLNSGEGILEELSYDFGEGDMRWFRASVQPIFDQSGRPANVVIYATDITAMKLTQKRLEERTAELLRSNQELIRANRARSDFLAMISHELRTPLTTILMLSEALETGLYGDLSPRQKKYHGLIHESGQHLLDLINDILDLTKIEAGSYEVQLSKANVREICQASLALTAQPAALKKIEVIDSIYIDTEEIITDPLRLKQMLNNLLSNAIKFTPQDGKIGLEVFSEPGSEIIHFLVWDTGIGIPAEKMGDLFQPFIQLDSNLNRQHEGAGMGLSLVRGIAEKLGGSVGVQSRPGQGSRFWVTLPMTKEPEEQPDSSSEPILDDPDENSEQNVQENKRQIVLAEDNDNSLGRLRRFLQGLGYRVLSIKKGPDLLNNLRKHQPDLLLVDLHLHGSGGVEGIRRLCSQRETGHIPIIAMSDLILPGERERCLEAGAKDYLPKPINLNYLRDSVALHLKG